MGGVLCARVQCEDEGKPYKKRAPFHVDRVGLDMPTCNTSSQLRREFEEQNTREKEWVEEQLLLAAGRNSSAGLATSTQRQSSAGLGQPDIQGQRRVQGRLARLKTARNSGAAPLGAPAAAAAKPAPQQVNINLDSLLFRAPSRLMRWLGDIPDPMREPLSPRTPNSTPWNGIDENRGYINETGLEFRSLARQGPRKENVSRGRHSADLRELDEERDDRIGKLEIHFSTEGEKHKQVQRQRRSRVENPKEYVLDDHTERLRRAFKR